MRLNASGHQFSARSWIIALALLTGAFTAHGADTYGPAAYQLQIPILHIGRATYTNVVLVFKSIVVGPGGSTPGPLTTVTEDTYDPSTGQLAIAAVNVGTTTYVNTTVTVDRLVSIGAVSAADTFDGTNLTSPYVEIPPLSSGPIARVHNVVVPVSVANVVKVGGGMPTNPYDIYDPVAQQLTISAVQVGSTVFTNVVVKPPPGVPFTYGSFAERQLHGFGYSEGAYPNSLLRSPNGDLYGTTLSGGSNYYGTVFKFTANGSGGYIYSVVYSFGYAGPEGYSPAGLVRDSAGNLYGINKSGGTGGNGTVFRLSPSPFPGGYAMTTLYTFMGGTIDGSVPNSLIIDSGGNLFGTTTNGGTAGYGTVFKLTPNGTGYTESVLYSFGNNGDGYTPVGQLALDAQGNLFGVTASGGKHSSGTVYKLAATGFPGAYIESVLYSFYATSTDGYAPSGGLAIDASGNLFGANNYGGANGYGTVFELSPGAKGYTETILYNFPGGASATYPGGPLVLDASGSLYGTTLRAVDSSNYGTVFRLIKNNTGGYSYGVVYAFPPDGVTNGSNPAGLFFATNGSIIGYAAAGGGSSGYGDVFEIY